MVQAQQADFGDENSAVMIVVKSVAESVFGGKEIHVRDVD
jgi:hypothetical protein